MYEGLPISPIIVSIGVGIGIGIDSCPGSLLALMERSNFAAECGVSTAIIRLRYPVLNGRIPSRVPSIPRPIATPTPI